MRPWNLRVLTLADHHHHDQKKKKLRTWNVLTFWMEIVLLNPKRAKWVVEQVDVHNGRRVFHVIIWGWLKSQRVWQTWDSLHKSIKSQPSLCRLIRRCNVFLYIALPNAIMNQLARFGDKNRYKRRSPLPHSTHHLFGFFNPAHSQFLFCLNGISQVRRPWQGAHNCDRCSARSFSRFHGARPCRQTFGGEETDRDFGSGGYFSFFLIFTFHTFCAYYSFLEASISWGCSIAFVCI